MHLQYFVGLDVHTQVIVYCVKQADGTIVNKGHSPRQRRLRSKRPMWRPGAHSCSSDADSGRASVRCGLRSPCWQSARLD